jgi:hypothetical protein
VAVQVGRQVKCINISIRLRFDGGCQAQSADQVGGADRVDGTDSEKGCVKIAAEWSGS